MQTSKLEQKFIDYWALLASGKPDFVREYVYGVKDMSGKIRRWRADFAWPPLKIAVEMEGVAGRGRKSRHMTYTGFIEDCVKYTCLAADGWVILRFTNHALENDPVGVIGMVCSVIEKRKRGLKNER